MYLTRIFTGSVLLFFIAAAPLFAQIGTAPARTGTGYAQPATAPARTGTGYAQPATAPARTGTGYAQPATAPARTGTGYAQPATAPARTGTGYAQPATAPARTGTGYAQPATVPAQAGTAPARTGTGYAQPGTVPAQTGTVPAPTGQKYTLRSARSSSTIDQVAFQLDIKGELQIEDKGKTETFPIKALTKLGYTEKLFPLATGQTGLRGARNYQSATAERSINEKPTTLSLSTQKNLIYETTDTGSLVMFNSTYPMTRDELDLLDTMGSSLVIDSLLPVQPVAVGQQWGVTEQTLKLLFRLETVTLAQVNQTLTEVRSSTAIIDTNGYVEGTVDGVKTVVSFKIKYYFSLTSNRITWMGLVTSENRKTGPVSPALSVESKIQMTITPGASDPVLAAAAWVPVVPDKLLLYYNSPDRKWTLFNDRRWVLFDQSETGVVFRFLDKGEFISQCIISPTQNPALTKGMTLEQFKAEVNGVMMAEAGAEPRKLIAANEDKTTAGLKAYQVVFAGTTEGTPIQWIYYLITGEENQQLIFLFIVEDSHASRIGQSDMEMIGTLSFK